MFRVPPTYKLITLVWTFFWAAILSLYSKRSDKISWKISKTKNKFFIRSCNNLSTELFAYHVKKSRKEGKQAKEVIDRVRQSL